MAYGIQTFNEAGQVCLDTSARLARLIATWVVPGAQISNGAPGTLPGATFWYNSPFFDGLVDDGTWFIDAPGTTNRVEFLSAGYFRIAFFIVYTGYSDVPVTVWRM